MNITLTGKAPGKINLNLKVLGRLDNGRHELFSALLPITLADEIQLTIVEGESGVSVTTDFSDSLANHLAHCEESLPQVKVIKDELNSRKNLTVKAAELFLSRAHLSKCSIAIRILKRIPFQAGLGGGSSDAATVLRLLADCFAEEIRDWPQSHLANLCSELGSDVLALFHPSPALIFGTGEKLARLDYASPEMEEFYQNMALLILKPLNGVPTGLAYEKLGLGKHASVFFDNFLGNTSVEILKKILVSVSGLGFKFRELCGELPSDNYELTLPYQTGSRGCPGAGSSLNSVLTFLDNDFKRVASGLLAEVSKALTLVESVGADGVTLCGSGSAVVGLFSQEASATEAFTLLQERIPEGWFLETAKVLKV